MPLVPNVKCIIPPTAVTVSFDSSAGRIGSRLYYRDCSAGPTPDLEPVEDDALGDSWEDVVAHGKYLALSPSKPTKNPPRVVSTASFHIGPCVQPVVQQLPFAFTWRPAELYLTLSDLRLRTYRVALPGPNAGTGQRRHAECSSRRSTCRGHRWNRSVQYFPPQTREGAAVVVVGPRHGRHPAPPVVVYLGERGRAGWVRVEDGEPGGRGEG
ncbi:hypothetical protein B0H67DRAFT_645521 [Lasiosphaeris hirsuta]|uniref:Uncharacterized protein n=1 Tax=Lasiosphaeris hirsuta TaxID=260670 RepID=A0AA40AHC9_9PEZI|nr:hypothetical protein B0H67DRAFT_645521 [Lasiosphaeris hirsuta]